MGLPIRQDHLCIPYLKVQQTTRCDRERKRSRKDVIRKAREFNSVKGEDSLTTETVFPYDIKLGFL